MLTDSTNGAPGQEGGKIFARDMVEDQVGGQSEIVKIFEDSTIFITGGTGFLGKSFIEKLLRICPKVKMIYLLVRPKKGKDRETRFKEIFDGPNMVPMKQASPKYLEQVSLVNGDCSLPDLGLAEEDKKKLIEQVNFVIHCAARVVFDSKLKLAAHSNVRAIRDLIAMAKQMRNLKGFLHISTAFSFYFKEVIGEEVYEPGLSGNDLLNLVEMFDDETLEKIKPELMGQWGTTYLFTKAIAENVIKEEAQNLPIVIFRPPLVTSTLREPIPGWIDNMYGPTGMIMGAALGILRTVHLDPEGLIDMVPADYVINSGLAILWKISCDRNLNNDIENTLEEGNRSHNSGVLVYNSTTSQEAPNTFGSLVKYSYKHLERLPTNLAIWRLIFIVNSNKMIGFIATFFLHTIPGYIFDFICCCFGKKPMMIDGYRRMKNALEGMAITVKEDWNLKNDNIQNLWKTMSCTDQKLFQFSMENFDWDNYYYIYVKGMRVYMLKDPMETLGKARIRRKIFFILHYTFMGILLFLFYKLLSLLWLCIY